ncbi:hypothetical protein OG2516_17161 [Oceanicola granulosus HTCC2516]|uniref:GumN family protein n=1 Tax=Oceanicola granulosus (strain ATCC BAA-861 / DSM 15982 / KCTC 12143 / HTCC2516) TaxID=314256 RepID=Q2CFL1_OCEGH|nr:TraB/GumN family protein [Oceanicola granulosus]EAR51471.1 hypothetical protein OG2516_17161 [Oceanicola granulosus HTCC2516]
MIRALALTVGLLLPGLAVAACGGPSLLDDLTAAESATLAEAVAETPYGTGLLWRATRDGREVTLLGTMHIHDPRHAALLEQVRPLIAAADEVLLEVTPREEAAMQAAIRDEPERIIITEGPTLPELVDAATWEVLSEAAAARQVPPFMAAKFQPWYLSLTLGVPPCAMPDLAAGLRGLDHLVMREAEAQGVPLRALEPWDTLFTLFDAGTMDEQIALLIYAAGPPELQTSTFVGMLDGYFDGRIAEVWELSRIATYRTPGLDRATADALIALTEERLLEQRNRAWLPVIEAAGPGPVLVAVGAAHLPGESGLLTLLAEAGWRIERLPLTR